MHNTNQPRDRNKMRTQYWPQRGLLRKQMIEFFTDT